MQGRPARCSQDRRVCTVDEGGESQTVIYSEFPLQNAEPLCRRFRLPKLGNLFPNRRTRQSLGGGSCEDGSEEASGSQANGGRKFINKVKNLRHLKKQTMMGTWKWEATMMQRRILEQHVNNQERIETVGIAEDWEYVSVSRCPELAASRPRFPEENEDPSMDDFSLNIPYSSVQRGAQIGQGAFGMVFEALWEGNSIAIKEVAEHHYYDQNGQKFIQSLKQELQLLAKVGRHPHVVRCYGGCLDPPHIFMLCQLADRSLADLIHPSFSTDQHSRPLPVGMALRITKEIAKGLNHLHSNNPKIVHRDLKPDNILLDSSCKAMVADFGLSRTKARSYVITANAHCGTAPYLAPEVRFNKVTEKVDIYALGVTLWECLTGLRPWDGYHSLAVLMNSIEGLRPEFPTDIFPERQEDNLAMHEVKKLVMNLWHADPNVRPDCASLLSIINNLQEAFPQLQDDH